MAGKNNLSFSEQDPAWIAEKVKMPLMDIIAAKGSTHYGIVLSLAEITRSIFYDEHAVLPVSVHLLEGQYQANPMSVLVPSNRQ